MILFVSRTFLQERLSRDVRIASPYNLEKRNKNSALAIARERSVICNILYVHLIALYKVIYGVH